MSKLELSAARNHSRTTNTIFNFISSIGGLGLSVVLQFVVRTVFIYTLGKSYLGIGGLFSNILSMLAIAELGVGNAILYKLYEPLKNKDERRIATLVHFYKSAYIVIGIVVAIIGMCLIPFLPKLIKNYSKLAELSINAVLIYMLYLFKSVSSYWFFAYKSAIIKADQKSYIVSIVNYVVQFATSVIQMVCLLLGCSFMLYVILGIGGIICHNCICAYLSNRMYPFLKAKNIEPLSREEIKEIFKDCAALFLYKLNTAVYKATDNIVISAFLGLDHVGLYTNYYVFYTTIQSLIDKVFESVAHSLGNLHAFGNLKHEYEVFKSVNLIAALLGGTAFVGIFAVADEFVSVWIGDDWLIEKPFAFMMGLELYTLAMRAAFSKYRVIMGLFRYAKLRPLASMLTNLVSSIILVQYLGISGVVLGTILADWLTFVWYDPLLVHRVGFKGMFPASKYFVKQAYNLAVVLCTAAVDYLICSNVFTGFGWLSVMFHAAVCAVTVPAAIIAANYKTQEARYVIGLGKKQLKKITKKLGRA